MKLELGTIISDRDGNQRVSLKTSLLFLLDNAAPGNRDLARQFGRLADKIAESNGSVELNDGEIGNIRACVEKDMGMKTWALEALDFHLWPHELADSDRERLERRHKTTEQQ